MLSGGNLQKVVLGREFSGRPKVLVVAAPTRGLDVGAIETVHDYLRQAAADGVAVLLISEDLDEVQALADRIAVMYEGAIVGERDARTATTDELGLLMAGVVLRQVAGRAFASSDGWSSTGGSPSSSRLALIAAFAAIAVVLRATGHPPWPTFRRLFDAAFLADGALSNTLISATPLAFTGLAAAVAFRSAFNIGAEGQLYLGAIGAAGIALYLADQPTLVIVPAMIVAGAAWGPRGRRFPGCCGRSPTRTRSSRR